jgi:sirohydrochlorin cobaltochelatase
MAERFILFAHGSRDPNWRVRFERLAADLAAGMGAGRVRLAYMEFSGPTLEEVVGEAARDGVRRLVILPLFLASGGHVANDIPPQVAEACSLHPEIEIRVLPPVGEDPRFAALVRDLLMEAVGDVRH